MKIFTNIPKILSTLAVLSFSTFASAGFDTSTDANEVILAGHDAVAYHTENRPVLGSERYTATYGGAIYRFSSAENRDLFSADPAKYAPAYGGFCALGTSFGKKFDVNGKAFRIVEGQLYVNKNEDIYATWVKDIPTNIEIADKNWPSIKEVAARDL